LAGTGRADIAMEILKPPLTVRRIRILRLLALALLGLSILATWVPLGYTSPSPSPALAIAPASDAWSIQAKASDRASVVPSPGRVGQTALQLQVLPGDTDVAGSGSRAERTDAMIGAALTDAVEGREQWWGWSTYFPSDYRPTPSTAWNIFLDFHNTGSDGQANINFLADTNFDPPKLEMTVYGGSSPQTAKQSALAIGRAHRNQWYDFMLHVVWSSNPHVGLVELFLSGRRIGRPLHRATLYDGQGAYLKLANYREAGPQPSAILTAAVRRSPNFASAVKGFRPFAGWARRLTLSRAQR
jgi:hypothetical protein